MSGSLFSLLKWDTPSRMHVDWRNGEFRKKPSSIRVTRRVIDQNNASRDRTWTWFFFCIYAEVWMQVVEILEIQKYTHLHDSTLRGYQDSRMTSPCLAGITRNVILSLLLPLFVIPFINLVPCVSHKTTNIHTDFQFLKQHFSPIFYQTAPLTLSLNTETIRENSCITQKSNKVSIKWYIRSRGRCSPGLILVMLHNAERINQKFTWHKF